MHEFLDILGQERDGLELLWIIAVLIFSALGGLSEWIKNKRSKSETDKPTPQPRKPMAPPRRSAGGLPPPSIPPDSRPQIPPRRSAPVQQRAPRAQPARKMVPSVPPRRPARPPLPQRGIPVQRPARHDIRQQPRISKAPPAVPTKIVEVPVEAELVRVSQMPLKEAEPPRPSIAKEPLLKRGQRLDRMDLRRAIVLNELLGLPVALRNEVHLWDR